MACSSKLVDPMTIVGFDVAAKAAETGATTPNATTRATPQKSERLTCMKSCLLSGRAKEHIPLRPCSPVRNLVVAKSK
jgi:hypothetical protein